MKQRYVIFAVIVAVACIFSSARVEAQQNKFKLKPGAKGKICLTCHADFQQKLKSRFIHTPVKKDDCTGCHAPHASSHGKMLAESSDKICFQCHDTLIAKNAVSAHQMAAKGGCVKCHDPHGSNNKFNLLKAGNELCFSCHKDMADTLPKVRFKHNPVQKGCTECHTPHASAKAPHLLKADEKTLCLKCHKTDKPAFAARHSNYPVARALCTTCHDPHGSNRGGILYDTVHKPVANKQCNLCHNAPNSADPFATKKQGIDQCKGCHISTINDILSKNRLHWPVASKTGCISCHNPHASSQKGLLKGPMLSVCGSCHGDILERQARSVTKHQPIKEGNCTACHAPHSSNNVFILQQASNIELCGTCHDWQKHSSHPIGDKVRDQRNKNLSVDCLSCHRNHGTENKNFIYFAQTSEMCTQCHAQYKR
jgi:DmsE family decaheme c-type cytochrome